MFAATATRQVTAHLITKVDDANLLTWTWARAICQKVRRRTDATGDGSVFLDLIVLCAFICLPDRVRHEHYSCAMGAEQNSGAAISAAE